MSYGSRRGGPGFEPCLGQAVVTLLPDRCPRTYAPDANLRYQEALDWRKWTKGGCSFLLLSAHFWSSCHAQQRRGDSAGAGEDPTWIWTTLTFNWIHRSMGRWRPSESAVQLGHCKPQAAAVRSRWRSVLRYTVADSDRATVLPKIQN